MKESSENTGDSDLEIFKKEMQNLKEQEEKGEVTTGHFMEINVSHLTSEDMEVWRRFKREGNLPGEFFFEYRESVKVTGDHSRQEFVAFLANKLTPIWMKGDIEKLDKN